MDKKLTGIIAYITIIGWIVAYLVGDKENAKFHLNQGLVLAICGVINGIICAIPLIGWVIGGLIGLFLLACMIIGIINASQDQEKELPLIGAFKIIS